MCLENGGHVPRPGEPWPVYLASFLPVRGGFKNLEK